MRVVFILLGYLCISQSWASTEVYTRSENFTVGNPCANCKPILNHSKNVLSVLETLASQLNAPGADRENIVFGRDLAKLQTLVSLVRKTQKGKESTQCNYVTEADNDVGRRMYEEVSAELQFISKVDSMIMDKTILKELEIKQGEKRFYYFRAFKNDKPIYVKLSIDGDGKSTLSYYKLDATESELAKMKKREEEMMQKIMASQKQEKNKHKPHHDNHNLPNLGQTHERPTTVNPDIYGNTSTVRISNIKSGKGITTDITRTDTHERDITSSENRVDINLNKKENSDPRKGPTGSTISITQRKDKSLYGKTKETSVEITTKNRKGDSARASVTQSKTQSEFDTSKSTTVRAEVKKKGEGITTTISASNTQTTTDFDTSSHTNIKVDVEGDNQRLQISAEKRESQSPVGKYSTDQIRARYNIDQGCKPGMSIMMKQCASKYTIGATVVDGDLTQADVSVEAKVSDDTTVSARVTQSVSPSGQTNTRYDAEVRIKNILNNKDASTHLRLASDDGTGNSVNIGIQVRLRGGPAPSGNQKERQQVTKLQAVAQSRLQQISNMSSTREQPKWLTESIVELKSQGISRDQAVQKIKSDLESLDRDTRTYLAQ